MFRKRFVARNTKKFIPFRFIMWSILVFLIFWITLSFLLSQKFVNISKNSEFQTSILDLAFARWSLKKFNLLSPKELFELSTTYILSEPSKEEPLTMLAYDDVPNDLMPRVYIYNTHDTEEYDSPISYAYNISYTTKIASYILRDYLRDLGIPTYVEKEPIKKYLDEHNLSYNYSYRASKYYMQKRMEEYPSLELFIDLHRDSVPLNVTKMDIEGVSYAKIMFVVGTSYEGYEKNLELANILADKLGSISRGIYKKAESMGSFNQDLGPKTILIEVGGVDNSIMEVNNSLKVFAKTVFEYLNEG